MSRRIALLGLSGVGKSTLIGRLADRLPVNHLEASALIKAEQVHRAKQPTSSETLRIGPVIENQELMIAAFLRAAAISTHPIVFDGHSVIDGRNGLIEIPSSVFAALRLDAICFLTADPQLILARRQADVGRLRPERDAATLAKHQNLALAAARRIADDTGRPLFVLDAQGIDQLFELLA